MGAIHTLTDVYAHSAHAYVYCLKEKKKVWQHLDHYTHNLLADISDNKKLKDDKTGKYGDNVNCYPGRFDTAKKVY